MLFTMPKKVSLNMVNKTGKISWTINLHNSHPNQVKTNSYYSTIQRRFWDKDISATNNKDAIKASNRPIIHHFRIKCNILPLSFMIYIKYWLTLRKETNTFLQAMTSIATEFPWGKCEWLVHMYVYIYVSSAPINWRTAWDSMCKCNISVCNC